MQKLSNVFKEAKKVLWDGAMVVWWTQPSSEKYICHAIWKTNSLGNCAQAIVTARLGKNRKGAERTVEDYLHDVVGVSWEMLNDCVKVQKYRKDWLTSLEKEFKEIERRFPKGVHHLDGDKNNWDLSNLVEIV